MATDTPFTVRLTADFFDNGKLRYDDIGLGVLEAAAHVEHAFFDQHEPEIQAAQIEGAQGIVVLTPKVTAKTLEGAGETLVIGRFGVGYDTVDVSACTEADVAAFITAGAVDYSVAEACLGWMIGLSHNMFIKDSLVREGEWDVRSQYMGRELRDRTLGVVGCGGIARKLLELTKPFGMNKPLVFDPFLKPDAAAALGVELVDLDTLLAQADFVSVHCPLTEQTRGLIGKDQLAKMKPTAYILNTARGGIIEEDALYTALESRQIAGAALDCFEKEPVTEPHRFGKLDNVLLAPHCIAWTGELFRDIGSAVCQGMVDVSEGKKPRGLLNPEVFDRPGFQAKLKRYAR